MFLKKSLIKKGKVERGGVGNKLR